MADKFIGYFGCLENAGRHIGALMITNESGIPQEFKYTEPIKPTRIQAILYGGSLDRYIKLDVIREKLFKSVSKKPDFMFVDNSDASFLGKCEGVSILMLQRASFPGLKELGATERPKENELLIRDHENRDPLRIVCHAEDAAMLEDLKKLVMDISYRFDITEPLDRVETALTALLKEKSE